MLLGGLLLVTYANCIAQPAFSVEKSDTTLYGLATAATFYGDIDLFNNQGSPFLMRWQRIEQDVPVGWTTSNCDPGMCHNVGVTTASFNLPVLPSYINTHFNPGNVPGVGFMKVAVWVDSNPTDSVVLTFYGVAGVSNVNSLTASDVAVFPNPAKDILNVGFPQLTESVQIKVLDLSGREVMRVSYQGGNFTQLKVAQLPAGMYMVQIWNASEALVTRKFLKE